jgi:hypothetical protein
MRIDQRFHRYGLHQRWLLMQRRCRWLSRSPRVTRVVERVGLQSHGWCGHSRRCRSHTWRGWGSGRRVGRRRSHGRRTGDYRRWRSDHRQPHQPPQLALLFRSRSDRPDVRSHCQPWSMVESPAEHGAPVVVRAWEPHRESHPIEKCLNH